MTEINLRNAKLIIFKLKKENTFHFNVEEE